VTAYDEVPYPSYAIRQTHISNLCLLGRLFGMQPADCARCRVLEIGGASGGNLLPMAAAFPLSDFVCLDPSPAQIEEGRRHAAALGLRNLRFEGTSIEKLGRKAQFDYVICHGVLSWVAQKVQDAIFAALKTCLSPNGIAIVSYKTLPGWHAYRPLREILFWHCAKERDPKAKARLAREMLGLLERGAQDGRSLWGPVMVAEVRRLLSVPDEFLLHDYLEEHNEAFYFSAFMERARGCGLQYLADAEVHTMYVGNPPPCIPESVARSDDIEALEQYIDFGLNRVFRQTVLCRASVALERTVARGAVDRTYIESFLRPEAEGIFRAPSGVTMSTGDPVAAEVLATLARRAGFPTSAETAVVEVRARLPDVDAETVHATFRRTVLQAFFGGGLQLYSHAPAYVASISTRPQALAVARHEAKHRTVVTNARHEAVMLSPLEATLLPKLDGAHTIEEVVSQAGGALPACRKALERFAATALLCA
jgi:methyltransferase-like protein/2-polyprenyl-3-methyl-5-hydroxy-6-metoxy-1,4-benzoquinol methylase